MVLQVFVKWTRKKEGMEQKSTPDKPSKMKYWWSKASIVAKIKFAHFLFGIVGVWVFGRYISQLFHLQTPQYLSSSARSQLLWKLKLLIFYKRNRHAMPFKSAILPIFLALKVSEKNEKKNR